MEFPQQQKQVTETIDKNNAAQLQHQKQKQIQEQEKHHGQGYGVGDDYDDDPLANKIEKK